ncbi:MAG: hypothetical protein ACKVIG_15735 [Flavobacteriales bacterium]
MKRFIDNNGIFELNIPVTWKYSLKEEKIHTFQEYEAWKSDSFQISINSIDSEDKKNSFLELTRTLATEKIGEFDFLRLPKSNHKDFTTETWIKKIDDKMVIFTITFSNNPDKELDNRTVSEKLNIVRSVIKNFKLIEENKKDSTLNYYRFDMFLQGIGATSLILSKAVANKAFIEATCILANQIDALLRIGIVLKNQINKNNRDIETEWIYQGLKDKRKSEKDTYKKSLELNILSQSDYNKLFSLYDDRNRVIHRFVISEITLAEVEDIAYQYYQQQQNITKLIFDIESEQIRLGIGMTRIDESETDEKKDLDYIKGKIGKLNYFDKK